MKIAWTLLCLLPCGLAAADLPSSPAPAGAKLYFITPEDGARTGREVLVRFGLKGMEVAPAGIKFDNTGHHHLLIDVDELPSAGKPIPADVRHVHFGGGQTEATITLEPGEHTLQLLLGDYLHVPHAPPVVSPRITITVE